MKLSTKIMRFVFLVTTSSRTDIVHSVNIAEKPFKKVILQKYYSNLNLLNIFSLFPFF